MEIRIAHSKDTNTIQNLAHEIWPNAYSDVLSNEQIEFMLEDMYSIPALQKQMEQGAIFLLAEETDGAVGFASFSPETPAYKIHKLYILPSQQGKGVGSKLLNFIKAQAQESKASFIDLNVNRNNPALNFYKRLGFEVLEEVDIPYNGFILNDYVMRKDLGSE